MTAAPQQRIPGDEASASVLVEVPPAEAFAVFTEEIDQWWRSGMRYRVGKNRSVVHLEPGVGGRLFESFTTPGGRDRVVETGRVTAWEPPHRLALEWRAVNFAPDEKTDVEVLFAESPSGTLVTVRHRGWSRLRADHPVRHGKPVAAFIADTGRWWGDLMTALRLHVGPRARPG